jgi:putative DNA primase/helicase
LPVKNGVVSLNTGELIPPDPEIIFTYRLPVRYDKNAECPKITKFLEEVFAGEEDTIPLILEMVGYCLYADGFMPAQSAFWWYGSGANGKDQLATIIENLLGEENISAIDLYELENNRFARGYLYGKLANILGEPNSRKLERSDVYKKATGGTPIDADRKFKGRFKFRNFAKFIIYANKYPEVSDATHAFWRRAVVIKFPNRFEKKKAEDVEIGRKISTPEEMSGFLNLALAALKRLRENNWDFSTTKSMEQTKTEFMMVSNPTGAFLRTRCTKDPTARIATDDLYDAYKDYCEENALTNESKIGFSRKLGEIPGVKGVLVKKDKKRVKGWRGIKVEVREPKNDTDVTDDTDEFSWKKSNEEEESEVDDKIWEYTSVSSGSSVSSSSNVNFDEGFEVYKYIKNRDHELPADGGVGCKEMHKAEKISDIPLERLWNILDKLCRKGKIRMVGGTPGGMRGGGDNFFRAEEG